MAPDPTVGPLICGTGSYVDGTYAWTDYAYDDTGASETALGGGVEPYPEEGANTADLIQLQLRPTDDGLSIRAVLQTLDDPAVPVLAVGFDTDADPATGAPTLPGDRWRADPPLGLEWVAVVNGGGGELREFADGAWNTRCDVRVDGRPRHERARGHDPARRTRPRARDVARRRRVGSHA